MKEHRVKQFQYDGFGFPLILLNVPIRNCRGVDIPDIDYNVLQRLVLEDLSYKPFPLTGNEIRFIRQSLEMTFTEFARHFGLTHAAIIKWEKAKNKCAKITPSMELYIRLYILDHLKVDNKQFRNSFAAFDGNAKLKKFDRAAIPITKPLKIESRKLCA